MRVRLRRVQRRPARGRAVRLARATRLARAMQGRMPRPKAAHHVPAPAPAPAAAQALALARQSPLAPKQPTARPRSQLRSSQTQKLHASPAPARTTVAALNTTMATPQLRAVGAAVVAAVVAGHPPHLPRSNPAGRRSPTVGAATPRSRRYAEFTGWPGRTGAVPVPCRMISASTSSLVRHSPSRFAFPAPW